MANQSGIGETRHFSPDGEPISLVDSEAWRFEASDLDRAVAQSARSLKPFLKAKLK